MLLARTDPDRSKTHRGLSLFVVPKPRGEGHGFEFTQEETGGGRWRAAPSTPSATAACTPTRSPSTDWFVPADNLIGGEAGLGRGFYYQMAGFENGRLQTAARAIGVMQAAYEAAAAVRRSTARCSASPSATTSSPRPSSAAWPSSSRPPASSPTRVARLMAKGEGALEASMVKAYVCKAAEWVTREAMQIHGGLGYAEEYTVSRYFVDARVLSIFEGADETLCLKVIARRLLEQAR